jgi:serine protease
MSMRAYVFGLSFLLVTRVASGQLRVESRYKAGDLEVADTGDYVSVIVGYKTRAAMAKFGDRRVLRNVKKFERMNAVAMQIPVSELHSLHNDTDVAYVEEDTIVHLFTEEVPWGIPAIQADTPIISRPNLDNDCFKICIVDSGLLVRHPDIVSPSVRSKFAALHPCYALPHTDHLLYVFILYQPYKPAFLNVEGSEIDLPDNVRWDQPIDSHGTHVSGIILAQGGNNEGIVGVIPNNQNICVLVARAFGDDPLVGTRMSATNLAVEWCADNGARVINMSLGGGGDSETGRDLMQKVTAEGILVVAAAGNEGNSSLKYPASYGEVMAVSAVDHTLQLASFSQFNSEVNIAAPGVYINSTIPTFKVFKDADDVSSAGYGAFFLGYSPLVNDPIKANLIDCNKGYWSCHGAEGKVCLIERGDNTFASKVVNCQNGGGIAAIIYNDDRHDGFIAGNLGRVGAVEIPVVEVERGNALDLRTAASVLIDPGVPSYETVEGTSAAAAFVSGVAARIWAARPMCTNHQVREALERSALDLGSPGRDDQYGHGLVQAKAAYLYLISLPAPCGDGSVSGQVQTQALSISSTLLPRTITRADKTEFIINSRGRSRGGWRERRNLKGSNPS